MGNLQGEVTKHLAPLFDETKLVNPPKNWLAFVGRGGGEIKYNQNVSEVEYEIIRKKRRMAKLIKRTDVVTGILGNTAVMTDLGSFTQVSRAFPLSLEEYPITSDKLKKKLPGEPVTDSGLTMQYRMKYWAAKGQLELVEQQLAMANHLAGQGIVRGYQEAILGTSSADEKYDFYRKSTHNVTLGVPWTTSATATPLDDLDDGCDVLVKDSGKLPEFALIGSTALEALNKTTQVTTYGNNLAYQSFFDLGANVSVPKKFSFLIQNGWEPAGRVRTLKGRVLWLFTSEEMEAVTAGSDTQTMPAKKVVLGNTNSRVDAQYGGPVTFPDTPTDLSLYQEWFGFRPGVFPNGTPNLTSGLVDLRMFALDAFQNPEKTVRVIRSQFSPLYIPVATDEWYTIENAGGN